MAFIKIISLPGGGAASCTKYFYKNGSRQNNKKWIGVGEIAEVPDNELDVHLATGKVMQVRGPNDASPVEVTRKRTKAAPEDGFDAVFAAQR